MGTLIDRIEELLSNMAAEDDEEQEQEDVFDLPVTEEGVPISLQGDERHTEDGGTQGDISGGRTVKEIAWSRPGPVAGEKETERTETAGELWKDGPVWTVRSGSPEIDQMQRTEAAERTARTEGAVQTARNGDPVWIGLERAVRSGTSGPALESAARFGPEQAGLKELYRQTVRGLRPAAPALPPEQTGRSARVQEPESAASLAVDELDRAVRRDSRRYDGGMSIY